MPQHMCALGRRHDVSLQLVFGLHRLWLERHLHAQKLQLGRQLTHTSAKQTSSRLVQLTASRLSFGSRTQLWQQQVLQHQKHKVDLWRQSAQHNCGTAKRSGDIVQLQCFALYQLYQHVLRCISCTSMYADKRCLREVLHLHAAHSVHVQQNFVLLGASKEKYSIFSKQIAPFTPNPKP